MNETLNESKDTSIFLDQLRKQVDSLASDLIVTGNDDHSAHQVIDGLRKLCELALDSGLDNRLVNAPLWETVGKVQQAIATEASANRHVLVSSCISELQMAIGATQSDGKSSMFGNLMEDPELVQDFIMESMEHLSTIESSLLKLEEDPSLTEPIHCVFRGFHTIKGLAGFLELDSIREVAHEVETVLDLARNLEIDMSPAVIDVVLASADYLKQAVKAVEQGLKGKTKESPPTTAILARVRSLIADKSKGRNQVVVVEAVDQASAELSKSQKIDQKSDQDKTKADNTVSQFSIRVETAKLDHLLDMVGELVIAQSMVRHDPTLAISGSIRLQAHLAHLNTITEEIQKTTMTLRMVPMATLFQRMKRLVRDVARKAGKQAELELVGEDTELDKTVVDGLADPLMHMVRNALDHGVEEVEEREVAGKPRIAQIGIKAYHQGGQMVIELSDDGRGLNRDKILAKAKQNGIVGENTPLTDAEIYQLIFEPGFSTADKVTDISGRGVGMDVVKRNILKMRGRVDIYSVPGSGTTFFIRLPLTLAIIDGLVVAVGTERYVVPIFAVTEMFRPTREMLSSLENKYEMVLVRGQLLPIVRLHRRFGIAARSEDPCQSLFIVTESDGIRFCLMVDEFIGKQEVVIKSLGDYFKKIPGIAGGAILGDGRVGLILEMAGLAMERGAAA